MKFINKNFLAVAALIWLIPSCISVAKINSFPKSANEIDFKKYSTEFQEKKEPFFTSNTSNEYYFERNIPISEDLLLKYIQNALNANGYSIYAINPENNYVIGQRGMQANEWKSITGIYYKINNNQPFLQIYLITKITQDFTGGFRENRAKKIGILIETFIDANK